MGFEPDEWIFGKVAKYFKNKKAKENEQLPQKVSLDEIKPRLTLLARAITGSAIEIYPAEAEGGWKGNNFFLPISFSELSTKEENLSFYFFRLIYLCVQKEKISIGNILKMTFYFQGKWPLKVQKRFCRSFLQNFQ